MSGCIAMSVIHFNLMDRLTFRLALPAAPGLLERAYSASCRLTLPQRPAAVTAPADGVVRAPTPCHPG